MTNQFSIIGDNQRKSRYDPNLADELVKDLEAQERREALKGKRGQKQEERKVKVQALEPANIGNSTMRYLGEEWGRKAHELVMQKYKIPMSNQDIEYKDEVVKGSDPFYVVAINEVLNPFGIRTATQADLENMLKQGDPLKFKGNYYAESSLVWRSNANPNKYLAEDIFNQFKRNGNEFVEGCAYVIPLYGLQLNKDNKSPHKLAFNLTNQSIYLEAPNLNCENQSKFSEVDEDGLPILDKKGNRTLYTRDSGLSRLDLGRNLNVNSDNDDIANSSDDGRVVCVSGEAGAFDKAEKGLGVA